jgi:putative membrane protein
LNVPLLVYLGNFGFATVMSLAAGFSIPVLLGVALGVAPAVLLWFKGSNAPATVNIEASAKEVAVANVKVAFK